MMSPVDGAPARTLDIEGSRNRARYPSGREDRGVTGEQLVSVEHDGAIATLTLQRADKKNALSIALRDQCCTALETLASDLDTKVVIVTGAGDVFSAGFDLSEFGDPSPAHQSALWESSDRFHHAVLAFPLPVIAAVNGPALAGGFDLACMADIRVASTSARFAHPEQRWTTVLYRIVRDLVGGATARDVVLTGRAIDAHEALALGLVVEVVMPSGLMAAATRRASMIAEAPREALVTTKAKIVAAMGISPDARTLDL
jgi:enoyl-CoA hydratase/carnithine racemase